MGMVRFDDLTEGSARRATLSAVKSNGPRLDEACGRASLGAALKGWTVYICVGDTVEAAFLREWVFKRGGLALGGDNCADILKHVKASGAARSLLILGPDEQQDTETIVDSCLALRGAAPTVPIILLLRNLGKNDFSTERMFICDVTLSSPIPETTFEEAVVAAISNNRYFCQRAVDGFSISDEDVLSSEDMALLDNPSDRDYRRSPPWPRLCRQWSSAAFCGSA